VHFNAYSIFLYVDTADKSMHVHKDLRNLLVCYIYQRCFKKIVKKKKKKIVTDNQEIYT